MANLMQAHYEWCSRPEDQRFPSLETLRAAIERDESTAHETQPLPRGRIVIEPDPDAPEQNIVARIDDGSSDGAGVLEAGFKQWPFTQLCQLAGAPSRYLGKLPPAIAASALNYSLRAQDAGAERDRVNLGSVVPYYREPQHAGDRPTLVAVTGTDYVRYPNLSIANGCARLQDEHGWTLPPDWSGRPSGAFYGDRNLFVVLIESPDASLVNSGWQTLSNPHTGRKEDLHRFVMIGNSTVGANSYYVCAGYMRGICGNLIVWGATGVLEQRVVHRGERVRAKIRDANSRVLLPAAQDGAARDADLLAIRDAMTDRLTEAPLVRGDSKITDELSGILTRRSKGALTPQQSRAAIEQAWKDGEDPRTVWGAVQGVTALARDQQYFEATADLSRAAAALMPARGKGTS